jgi:5'-3' exonuclease
MKPALLVDGNNLAVRAIHAARHSHMSAAGINTGPLKIFIDSFARLVRDYRPHRIAVAWDSGGSDLRTALLPQYKGNRHTAPDIRNLQNDIFPLLQEFLDHLGITQVAEAGHEADDIIASWWQGITRDEADVIVIASSDKDFLQLVGPNPDGVTTKLVRLSSADTPTDEWTAERMVAELGYSPAQWPLLAALSGDVADNVPGIPGIGFKRAQKLLERHGWNLVTALREEYPAELIRVQDNLLVVNLREVPEDLTVPPPGLFHPNRTVEPILIQFLDLYELTSVKERLMAGTMWIGSTRRVGRPFQLEIPLQRPSA